MSQRDEWARNNGFDPESTVYQGAVRWMDQFNARCKPEQRIVGRHAVEYLHRCVSADLDPMREPLTAYVNGWTSRDGVVTENLVWHPEVDTYYGRAEATGRYLGSRLGSFARERDGAIIAFCEVDHLAAGLERSSRAECRVDQWQSWIGRGSKKGPWGKAPEHMAQLAAMRAAMRAAFPGSFRGIEPMDGVPVDDGQSDPDPAPPSPRSRPTSARREPPAAAREALSGSRPSAPQPGEQQTMLAPPMERRKKPPITAADLRKIAEREGYSERDLVSICNRLRSVTPDDANEAQIDFIAKGLKRRPATAAQFDELTDLQNALGDRFASIAKMTIGRYFDPRYATRETADQVIAAGRKAVASDFAA